MGVLRMVGLLGTVRMRGDVDLGWSCVRVVLQVFVFFMRLYESLVF